MPPAPELPGKRETKSDQLRHSTVEEYIRAHAKPNGNGIKGFFHSNLFIALLMWCLSQAVFFGGLMISFYFRTASLYEWQGEAKATLKRMDDQGTVNGHYANQREDESITRLDQRVDKLEDVTKHVEVIETEHRHLVQDVEELKHGKK